MNIYDNTSKLIQIYQNRDGEKFLKDFLRGQLEELNCNCTEIVWDLSSQPLRKVNLPRCEFIESSYFSWNSTLTEANLEGCKIIDRLAFASCPKLSKINLPNCETIYSNAFIVCFELNNIDLPKCTTIQTGAFHGCDGLTNITLPVCSFIGQTAFTACDLYSINLPACTSIGSSAFAECYNLSEVYLEGSSVCKLAASNAFNSTPFAGVSTYFSGTPQIYVPEDLIEDYKADANWSYFSSYFTAI